LPRVSTIMLTNGRGRPWQGNSFRKAWGAITDKAGIVDLTLHDLRGTAVTRFRRPHPLRRRLRPIQVQAGRCGTCRPSWTAISLGPTRFDVLLWRN
jgi:hypothetical protein